MVAPANPIIAIGTKQFFCARGTFRDSSSQNITNAVTWNSSNTDVAHIVNIHGMATALASVTTFITAISATISSTASLNVIVIKASMLWWNAPQTNIDGSFLPRSDIADYHIYYVTRSGSYSDVLHAGNATTYTINEIPSGTYFFAIMAYDTSGNESDYSNEISKSF